MSSPCIVINKFIVPEAVLDQFLTEFAAHRTFLAARPGFLTGTLYRKQGGPGRFNIVNIAHWEGPDALEAARSAMGAYYAEKGTDPGAVYRRLGVKSDIASYSAIVTYGPPRSASSAN